MDRWVEVARRRRLEVAAAVRRFAEEACRVGDVVLFGSRARGEAHGLSDWDLAVFLPGSGEPRLEAAEFGQVLWVPRGAFPRFVSGGLVALDVAADGVLLCGRGELWQEYRRMALSHAASRGLTRTRAGWYPVQDAP